MFLPNFTNYFLFFSRSNVGSYVNYKRCPFTGGVGGGSTVFWYITGVSLNVKVHALIGCFLVMW